MVAHTYNSNTWEDDAGVSMWGGSLWVRGQAENIMVKHHKKIKEKKPWNITLLAIRRLG